MRNIKMKFLLILPFYTKLLKYCKFPIFLNSKKNIVQENVSYEIKHNTYCETHI